ncbi:MAG: nicotinamide riboside transporter PnuC [Woeseiaceae bacterium]
MGSGASNIWAQLAGWSAGEITAVVFAILYLFLAIRENIWCWFCAGVSTTIYIGVYFGAKLYMESLLNVFYLVMAIYGWYVWRSGGSDSHLLPVVKWPIRVHLIAIAAIATCVLASGYLLDTYTDAAFPYIDSATTFAAIWATFLVARKVLENWWYWLAIDAVSVVIYWSRGLELTSILFVAYLAMIPFGLLSWTKSWHRNQQSVT